MDKVVRASAFVWFCLLATPLLASGARIEVAAADRIDPACRPISKPTVIREPGCYVVVSNIRVNGTPAITIDASNVRLNLNGQSVIGRLQPTVLIENGRKGITIENGYLRGDAAIGDNYSNSSIELRMENLVISVLGFNVKLEGLSKIEIVDCTIVSGDQDSAIRLSGPSYFTGRITGNAFSSGVAGSISLMLQNFSNGLIQDNDIGLIPGLSPEPPSAASAEKRPESRVGFHLVGGSGNRIERNNLLYSEIANLWVESNDNLIRDNLIRFVSSSDEAAGITISGSRNLIDGNRIVLSSGWGIVFKSGSSDNVYRNNMFRANAAGAILDQGVNNTDAGGNVK